jgi:hypothetical protein
MDLLKRVGFLALWSYLGHILFGLEFSILSFLGLIGSTFLYQAIRPFVRVIICNVRKVPYNGEEGSARRSSSGSRGD